MRLSEMFNVVPAVIVREAGARMRERERETLEKCETEMK